MLVVNDIDPQLHRPDLKRCDSPIPVQHPDYGGQCPNLGTALALQGKKVAVVDSDIGLRNLDAVLGLENRIVYDLVDVVEGQCRLRQALIKDKRLPELYLLPAAQTRDKNAVNSVQMEQLCQQLRQEF